MFILVDNDTNKILNWSYRDNIGELTINSSKYEIPLEQMPREQYLDHYEYINGEVVAVLLPQEEIDKQNALIEISELRCQLQATDYVVIKIAEGVATTEEYAEVIAQRQEWRTRINELEELNG